MITFLVALIIVSPRCEDKPKLFWWQNSIIYKIDMDQIKKLNSFNSEYSPLESYFFNLLIESIF